MFVILYCLKEDEYENWHRSEYNDFQQAINKYEEYCNNEKYDRFRLLKELDSTYK